MTIKELIEKARARRDARNTERTEQAEIIKGIQVVCQREQRDPTADEAAKVRAARSKIDEIDAEREAIQARLAELEQEQLGDDAAFRLASELHPGAPLPGVGRGDEPKAGTFVRASDGRPAAVARGQRWSEHPAVAENAAARSSADQAVVGSHGSLGQMVRAMTTTSGSAIVPTVWAGDIIDRARNLSALLRAGAEIVPMDAKTVQIGRLTGDPTAAFRTEGSTITASDPTFDNVTLDSKTLSALVVGSLEWFQDGQNVDEVVSNAIAQAIATTLDLQGLFGGVTAGGEGFNFATPPNPRGILATLLAVAASSVIGSGANGTVQTAATFWREVQSTVFLPQTFNEMPNALLWNAKLAQQYVDAYDTTNQPLNMPANIGELDRFTTNQIPSFTQGTMTSRATDLFAGDFTQLLIGQRLDLTIQTLVERYAENGQIGIVAHWRGDVGLARPRAFAVYRYLQGAA